MKIRIIGHSGEPTFPFGSAGPWKKFAQVLLDHGHQIIEGDFEIQADAIIANHHNKRIKNHIRDSKIPKNRRALILWEPKIVENTRYKRKTRNFYGKSYAPSYQWAIETNSYYFPWPQDVINNNEVFSNWEQRLNRIVTIQGNKYSAHSEELYSLRRKIFSAYNQIDLFGTNWNRGKIYDLLQWLRSLRHVNVFKISLKSLSRLGIEIKNYKGEIENKTDCYKNYKIALVIENCADFVSEKLFDAVRGGCVVIYVGPKLTDYEFPSNLIIQPEINEKDISEAISMLTNKSSLELKNLAEKQFKYFSLHNDKWRNTLVLQNLAEKILEDFSR